MAGREVTDRAVRAIAIESGTRVAWHSGTHGHGSSTPFCRAPSLTERGAVSSIEAGVVGVAFDEDVAVVDGRVVVAAGCDDVGFVGWAALRPGDDVVEV